MEIILMEKIANLGNLGDQVSVKPGYGRNYLIPQGKATLATAEKLAEFEKLRVELEKKAAEEVKTAQTRADAISALTVTIVQKAGSEGKLFGSVGTHAIAEAVTNAGQPLNKSEVRLPDGALRHTGDYEVDLALHLDVVTKLTLIIIDE